MKMTVSAALASHQALAQLGQTKWPFQASMAIAKNKKELSEVGQEYERRRQELVKKHGKANDKGDLQVPPELVDKFTKEALAIQAEEVELDLKTVTLLQMKGDKREDPDIEPNILEHLVWMFDMTGQKPTRRKRK